ncbi:MAG: ABC transporter substrate-binding protein [Clostridiales Family XIII bacterium]|jgi:NitT/TauT family transport system substrate-binding protein|nr:ABC transporter substrate-binding protein [Clostridiales Family XIII bacterium]
MNSKKSKKIKVLAIALALAMTAALLASCAAKEEKPAGEGQTLDKITVQTLWVPQGQFAGLYIADARDYYEEEGIDIEILPGGTDVTPADQVENDVAQVGVLFYSSLLTYQEGGYDFINVFQNFQGSPQYLVAKKDTGIATGADLKGKKIGTWGAQWQVEFAALLGKYDLGDSDVTWVQQDYTMDQFINDEIDAASAMAYNEWLIANDEGWDESNTNIIDLNKEGTAMLEDCLFVKRDWAEANEDLLVRFLRATKKGWDYAIQNPEESGKLIFETGNSATEEHQIKMTEICGSYVQPEGATAGDIGKIDEAKAQQTIDFAKKYGLIKGDIALENSIDVSYWEKASS